MRRWPILAMLIMVFTSSILYAQPTPRSVELALKGQPGEESKYATKLDLAMEFNVADPVSKQSILSVSPRAKGTFVTAQEILGVAQNGDLTISGKVESFDLYFDIADVHIRLAIQGPEGGPPQLIKLPPLPLEMVISKRGKLVTIKGLEKLPIPPLPAGPKGEKIDLKKTIGKFVEQIAPSAYPDKPVQLGDSWEWQITIDPEEMMTTLGLPVPSEAKQQMAAMKFPIRGTSKLIGFEIVNGIECAMIEAAAPWQVEAPIGGSTDQALTLKESGLSKITTWFDDLAGRIVKERSTFEMNMTVGDEQDIVIRMSMVGESESTLVM